MMIKLIHIFLNSNSLSVTAQDGWYILPNFNKHEKAHLHMALMDLYTNPIVPNDTHSFISIQRTEQ